MTALRLYGSFNTGDGSKCTENEIIAVLVDSYGVSCLSHSETLQAYLAGAQELSQSDQKSLMIVIKEEEAGWVAFVEHACDNYYEEIMWMGR